MFGERLLVVSLEKLKRRCNGHKDFVGKHCLLKLVDRLAPGENPFAKSSSYRRKVAGGVRGCVSACVRGFTSLEKSAKVMPMGMNHRQTR